MAIKRTAKKEDVNAYFKAELFLKMQYILKHNGINTAIIVKME